MWKKLKKNRNKSHNEVENIDKILFFLCGMWKQYINEIKLWKSTYRSLLIIGVTMIENTRSTSIYYRVSPDSNDFNSKPQKMIKAVVSIYMIYIYLYIHEVLIAYE